MLHEQPSCSRLRWRRNSALAVLAACMLFVGGAEDGRSEVVAAETATDAEKLPNRPKVPGTFRLRIRSREEIPKGSGQFQTIVEDVDWNVSETAIIICDMWDDHYCKSAAERVEAMAPRMNRIISAARSHGAMIIHAPSGTMKFYAETPYRQRMQQAEPADPPAPLQGWCHRDPSREPELPVDTSNGPCDDPVPLPAVRHYSRQHPAIKISGYDGISDSGQEIYNFIHQEGIKNIVLMGVHTNMCVLGRPFGIRQMTRLGMNVVLARDLTDAMYDPRSYPYVSHTRGTELVIEHIETYWCPSILGDDLTRVVPGSADPDPKTLKQRPRPQTTAER